MPNRNGHGFVPLEFETLSVEEQLTRAHEFDARMQTRRTVRHLKNFLFQFLRFSQRQKGNHFEEIELLLWAALQADRPRFCSGNGSGFGDRTFELRPTSTVTTQMIRSRVVESACGLPSSGIRRIRRVDNSDLKCFLRLFDLSVLV